MTRFASESSIGNAFFGFLKALRHTIWQRFWPNQRWSPKRRPASFNSAARFDSGSSGLGTTSSNTSRTARRSTSCRLSSAMGTSISRSAERQRNRRHRSLALTGRDPALRVRRAIQRWNESGQRSRWPAWCRTGPKRPMRAFRSSLTFAAWYPFPRVKEVKNEVELVILVQPELVAPLDACDVRTLARVCNDESERLPALWQRLLGSSRLQHAGAPAATWPLTKKCGSARPKSRRSRQPALQRRSETVARTLPAIHPR